MESALFRDFFGNFFHVRWKILFSHGGEHTRCVWNEHRKTRNSEKLKFLFWVEGSIGGYGRVWGSHEVGHTRWVTWGGLCEVDHARWVMRGGSHEVGYVRWITWGGLHEVGYARWVMRGGLREVDYARWITRDTSHLVKCFTPWYYYYSYQEERFSHHTIDINQQFWWKLFPSRRNIPMKVLKNSRTGSPWIYKSKWFLQLILLWIYYVHWFT